MPRLSAGLLVHRDGPAGTFEVLLVHPGGPFWANKDEHAWSIPKGEYDVDEDAEACALREFEEELGRPAPDGDLIPLGSFQQSSSKTVTVWAIEGDLDVDVIESNTFEMEWPPRSGTMARFPEVDRAEWFDLPTAKSRIHKGQRAVLDRLEQLLTASGF